MREDSQSSSAFVGDVDLVCEMIAEGVGLLHGGRFIHAVIPHEALWRPVSPRGKYHIATKKVSALFLGSLFAHACAPQFPFPLALIFAREPPFGARGGEVAANNPSGPSKTVRHPNEHTQDVHAHVA